MQYILSEEEMAAVRADSEALRKAPHPEALVNVCQHIATTMVGTSATAHWPKGRATPHGCIHVDKSARYCDRCPVRGICPQKKEFSK